MLAPEDLDYALIDAIPLHRTLGMRVIHDRQPPAVSLPERADLANHIGATAGAAVFAVAEAASAAMVFASYSELVERYFAIPAEAKVRFRRPAVGALRARAVSGPPLVELARELEETGETILPVDVEVRGADGCVNMELTVHWTFRPMRSGSISTMPRRGG